jgi:hypothetical protein
MIAGAKPVFQTEDLMNLFRNAVIPTGSRPHEVVSGVLLASPPANYLILF